jgi:AcrR family transcriptional regulator
MRPGRRAGNILQPPSGSQRLAAVVNSKPTIQRSSGDQFRREIVAAARSRFQRYGYAKTSMQEIAEDCGMSAANLYRYYDGKLAIGLAVARAEQATLFATCDRAVATAGAGGPARLVALFHALIDGSRHQIKSARPLFELSLIVSRERSEYRRHYLQEIETRIVAALGGETPAANGEEGRMARCSRLILIASAPFVLPWMMQNEPFGDPRPQVGPLIRCLISGMVAEQPLPATAVLPG